jgi:hypothetical protein
MPNASRVPGRDRLASSVLPLLSPAYGSTAQCPHLETLYLDFCKAHTRAFAWLEKQRSVSSFQQIMIDQKKKATAPLYSKKGSTYDQKRLETMDLYSLLGDVKHRAHHYLAFLQRYRELTSVPLLLDFMYFDLLLICSDWQTPDALPDPELVTALDSLSALSTQISYDQNLSELTGLVARIRRLDTILSPTRNYLGHAVVKTQARIGGEDIRTLILFDDQLVVACAFARPFVFFVS